MATKKAKPDYIDLDGDGDTKEPMKKAAKDKKTKGLTNETLADMADVAERDHEVQMARSDLYKLAKYSMKLHEMLSGISETTGLQGWQQAKITKASDYISSVYHSLDYDLKTKSVAVPETVKPKRIKPVLSDSEINQYKGKLNEKLNSRSKNR